ncbi:DUF6265 family protein [Pseudomarimonas arenosa]|uniref:DUF6265 domain-containing protein n=1 Tax=Pseudomarimonas arenosa TaxID=2774145 RepID=A0AAW3ZHU3_9GAMM|nr:DUF6265 family protein [Pseudomarimonas arenosa]MBD8524309.1 hypothetical protein [Pseudomarimonas arenosa]
MNARRQARRDLALLLLVLAPSAQAEAIEQLRWMTGCWAAGDAQGFSEEYWTPPRAGSMFGVNRSQRGSSKVAFEFLRIEQDPQGMRYLAQPGGRAPTVFTHQPGEPGQRVVFVNPEHDFPTRIEYWREGDDLKAKVSGGEGAPVLQFHWQPCGSPSKAAEANPS